MVQFVLPARMSIPVTDEAPVPKKSKILLLLMMSPMFRVLFPAVPSAEMDLIGRLLPAGPMLFAVIVLLLLPEPTVRPVVVLKSMFPPAVPTGTVDDPRMEQFLTMSFDAPLMKRIVLVPAAAPVLMFENVSEFPPEFK